MTRAGRFLATAAAVGLLATHTVPNAAATVIPFDPVECRVAAEGTAEPRTSWHLERLRMRDVWHLATGKGVTVAVIDTGVASSGSLYLQDAPDKRFTVYDLAEGLDDPKQRAENGVDCNHGTWVTSLLAAGRSPEGKPVDSRVEFSGIAPDARVISYRTLTTSGGSEEGDDEPMPLGPTIEAVIDAVERGVDVINLSLVVDGRTPGVEELGAAIELALSRGIIVVAASGNTDQIQGSLAYPASFEGVISVGASNRADGASDVSQYGATVDVGAPGDKLIALSPSRGDASRGVQSQVYSQPISGTSFAAPIVSGVVALMIERQAADGLAPLTPAEVKQRLVETADPPSSSAPDLRLGAGIVNPLRVLSGEVPQRVPNEGGVIEQPAVQFPPRKVVDQRPAMIGIAMGIGAVMLSVAGIVAAIVVPAARRARATDADKAPRR